jgi:heme exporter protein B
MRAFLILLRRELALAWGNGGGPLLALAFYACVVTLLPLAAGRAPERLASLAPGIAWLALALAALLSLERLFERDFEDGALDLLALGPAPLEAVAVAKCLAHWLAAGAPLALAAPIAALALGASPHIIPLLIPCALAGGLLVAVIVLPLYVPPVIFGAGALDALAGGLPWTGGLFLLLAYSAAAVALGPIAMAAACRNALD